MQRVARKAAFSLIELLIVIALISLAYYFIFSNVKKQGELTKTVLSPLTLKDVAKELMNTQGELFCIAKCKECFYSVSRAVDVKRYEGKLNFGKDIKIYKLDRFNNFEAQEFGRIDDEKVCLRFNLHLNQSSTKLVIQNDQGIFYIPSYFGQTQEVGSLQEAKELWLKYNRIATSSGDFY
ncbi:MAG: type II secretion system protein [Campylobacterota bacterium]|nr:type II secretion system protein [Campylobacterota bacterium]